MLSTGVGQANPPRWFNTAISFAFTKSRIHGLATYDTVLIVLRATVRRCDKMFDTGFAAWNGFSTEETAVPLQKE